MLRSVEQAYEAWELEKSDYLPVMSAFVNRRAVLGTQHGKEQVIAPILAGQLGITLERVDIDTDAFGTFTRERARQGTAHDAARRKAKAALAAQPGVRLAVASEGSFAPHPEIPFVMAGAELVLLLDTEQSLEIWGHDVTLETNAASAVVRSVQEALAFAARVQFPSHALVVMGMRGTEPDVQVALHKGVHNEAALVAYLEPLLATRGQAWIESDMRAHMNPTRMRSIERATQMLCTTAHRTCPRCERPGFELVDVVRGIPCAWCGTPTQRIRADVLRCAGCTFSEQRLREVPPEASPAECDRCNP